MTNKKYSDNRVNRRGGFYWDDGHPLVSVTTILQSIAKPLLLNWYGKMVYQAVIKDTSLSEQQALNAVVEAQNKAKARGTLVHSAVEAFLKSGKRIITAPSEAQGYINSFFAWFDGYEIEPVEQEFSVISYKHGYAGTTDIWVKMGKKNVLIDVKTGKYIYPEAFLQLSAYREALLENGKQIDEIGVLLLGKNGTYKFEIGEPDFDTFLAVKKVWEWQNKDLCEEVGYKYPIDK